MEGLSLTPALLFQPIRKLMFQDLKQFFSPMHGLQTFLQIEGFFFADYPLKWTILLKERDSSVLNVLPMTFVAVTLVPYQSKEPFTKLHKLVYNCGFPKFEVLCYSQNYCEIDQGSVNP